MRKESTQVKSGEESWEFTSCLPESIEEATNTYGAEGTLFLLQTALQVKQQGIARICSKKGMSREDVDAAVESYKPGSKRGGGSGLKEQVYSKLIESSGVISADSEVRDSLREAIKKGEWKGALEILNNLGS